MSLSDIDPRIDPGTNAGQGDIKSTTTSIKDTVVSSERHLDASAAANAIKEHPITQNITNGPVAQSVSKEAQQTSNEFGGLANARQTPQHTAANGQSLTHYHSFFYTLLSWEHPRATGISFAATLAFIFACRYLPVLKWTLKLTYLVLGVVTLTEAAAKAVMNSSVTSSVRPRRYYRIPKESLEASLDDLEHLINFFVIETQRIIFAENIPVTALAFTSAFVSYYLIKILPFWGLALVFTCVVYLAPLIYVQNKELIDGQLEHAGNVIGQQTQQVRDLTAEHASKGLESLKSYTSDYTAKATEYVGSARQKIPVPAAVGGAAQQSSSGVKNDRFPAAPKTDLPSVAEHSKPAVHAPTEDASIAASAS